MSFHHWKLVLFSATCLITNTTSAFFAGTKAPGMGATGIAYPQDAFAGAYNPAGILEIEDRLDLAATCIYNRGHATIHLERTPAVGKHKINGKFNPFDSAFNFDPSFGINKTFCTSWEWAIGIVGYNRERQKTSYNRPVPLLGKNSKLGMEYIHDVIAPILSFRITSSHTFGVSFDWHLQRISIKGLDQFAHEHFSSSPSHVTNNGNSYSSGFGATLGWTWKALDGLTIGAVYRSRAKMTKFRKYKGFLAERGRIDPPTQWGFGVAYQFIPCAIITADIEWIQWSQIKSLHNPLLHKNEIVQTGTDHGPGFGFKNQVFYRIGIDYAFNQSWTVRAGYQYANTSTKNSQTMLNLLFCRTSENLLTLGASYIVNRCNEISFFYAHSFEKTVKGQHSIPTIVGPGHVNLAESKDYLGLSWAFIF